MDLPRRYFTAPPLDRAAELRDDEEGLARRFRAEDSRVLPLHNGRVALRPAPAGAELGWLPSAAFAEIADPVFLGMEGGSARFSLRVSEDLGEQLAVRHRLEFHSLRRVAATIDGPSAGVGAYALAMDLWQASHRFCGACGAGMNADQGGFRLLCGGCGKTHFPRLDPAIIVSVRAGDACLLGRQAAWPARRYSVLAGFVEPGESLEDAVAREVFEEAGVAVETIRYRGSQPWPFPSSLMLGFSARAIDRELVCGEELEDVRWFEPDDLLTDLAAGRVLLPPPLSISRFLVDEWLHDVTGSDPATWARPEDR